MVSHQCSFLFTFSASSESSTEMFSEMESECAEAAGECELGGSVSGSSTSGCFRSFLSMGECLLVSSRLGMRRPLSSDK